jgi:hypothetical protein
LLLIIDIYEIAHVFGIITGKELLWIVNAADCWAYNKNTKIMKISENKYRKISHGKHRSSGEKYI